jgi:hypothetical protein
MLLFIIGKMTTGSLPGRFPNDGVSQKTCQLKGAIAFGEKAKSTGNLLDGFISPQQNP